MNILKIENEKFKITKSVKFSFKFFKIFFQILNFHLKFFKLYSSKKQAIKLNMPKITKLLKKLAFKTVHFDKLFKLE